jgi:diguanylate cyclase (GGDEF)-like protein/PAS domain S-box-containing protein
VYLALLLEAASLDWIALAYSITLFVGSVAAVVTAAVIWRRQRGFGSAAAALALVGSSIWMLGYLGELNSTTLAPILFYTKVQYVGVAIVPSAWLAFILQYSGFKYALNRPTLALLAGVPAAMLVMVFTNDLHHWVWTTRGIIEAGPFHRLDAGFGVGFWVFVGSAYAMLAVATFLTLQLMLRAHSAYRLQVLANVLAAAVPWVASIHDLFRFGAVTYLDLTPLAFTFTSAIMAWNLLRWRMIDLLPFARGVILESMVDALVVVDAGQRVVDLNRVASSLLGRSEESVVGQPLDDAWPDLAEYVRNPTQKASTFGQLLSGQDRYFDVRVSPLRDLRGGLMGTVYALRDVSSRVATEEALRDSETRYALAAQGANDGLWDWDLRREALYLSPRAEVMLSLDKDAGDVSLETAFAKVHPDDLELLQAGIDDHLAGQSSHLEREFRVPLPTGGSRWLLCRGLAVRDASGEPYRLAGSLTDITDHKAAEGHLRYAALHDSLTGLPNRALLMDRLDHALQRTRRDASKSFAVLFLDLDRFKLINDSQGHHVGDLLLKEVAVRLVKTLREVDTVARLGGDEFVVILEGIENLSGAERAAERVQEAVTQPFNLEDREVYTSASIGIAVGNRPNVRPEEMLRDADLALYQAKSLGGGRYALFDERLHQQAVTQFELEVDLRRCLESDAMHLYYQPIRSLASRQLVGFEALLRWEHPRRGLLPPSKFLPIAEETGMIVPIGRWVLRTACSQLRAWKHQFPSLAGLSMSINASARELAEDDIVQKVKLALETAQIRPDELHLEITESIMIEDGVLAAHRLGQLRALGVQVHIDDFGTGYSSLSVLHNFPVDSLKIERSFIDRLEHGGRDAKIVEAVISLARSLDLDVIAEGIESEDQLIRLMSLGCELGQGYLLGEPQPAEAIEALLEASIPAVRSRKTELN